MPEPSLEGVMTSTEAAGPAPVDNFTPKQKLAVAAGIAGIGLYVGYTVAQSYRADTPQSLWPTAASAVKPRIALVNLSEEVRPFALEGLQAWLDLDEEVDISLPTVMFVEEDEAVSIGGIAADVRQAALFAHVETRESCGATAGNEESASSPPHDRRCTVVYRSVTEVDGHALEDWDVDVHALQRWHGMAFVRRHCVGFTVDGTHVMVLVHDVEGVLEVNASTAAVVDGASLVRECGVPTAAAFHRWQSQAAGYASAHATSMTFATSTHTTAKAKPLQLAVRDGHQARLWQTPFALFSLLGAVLRYNTPEAAVYPALLRSAVLPSASSASLGMSSAPWAAAWKWCRRVAGRASHRDDERVCPQQAWRRCFTSPFVVLLSLAPGHTKASAVVQSLVDDCVAQWISSIAGHSPSSPGTAPAVLFAIGEKKGTTTVRVDLTQCVCTVLEAAWLSTHLVVLLNALGMAVARLRLVAVPGSTPCGSRLYPTGSRTAPAHCWKPERDRTLKEPVHFTNPRLACLDASARSHPGWVGVQLGGTEHAGFVVAEHNLASFA